MQAVLIPYSMLVANALGLTIPSAVLLRADHLVE
jgi:hypothetical protein